MHTATANMGSPLNALSASPDFSRIAVGGREVFKIVSIEENGLFKERTNLRTGKVNRNYMVADLKWHPTCSNLIASAPTNSAVVLWDLNKKSGSKMERTFTEHERTVNKVCWWPRDPNLLLSGSQDEHVKQWDIRQPGSTQSFKCNGEVRDVQINCHYSHIFATSTDNGVIQLWDTRSNKCTVEIPAHNGPLLTLDWHPQNKYLIATGGRDRVIKIWDTNTTQSVYSIQTIASLSRVHWRPGYNDHIASCAHMVDRRVHLWDVKSPYLPIRTMEEHSDVVTGLLFYRGESDRIVTCSKDNTIALIPIADAQRPRQYMPVSALSWNAKNELAAVCERVKRQETESKDHQLESIKEKSSKRVQPPADMEGIVRVWRQITNEQRNMDDNEWSCDEQYSPQSVIHFAKYYCLFGDLPITEKCKRNAKVAADIHESAIEKVWTMLMLLYLPQDQQENVSGLSGQAGTTTTMREDEQVLNTDIHNELPRSRVNGDTHITDDSNDDASQYSPSDLGITLIPDFDYVAQQLRINSMFGPEPQLHPSLHDLEKQDMEPPFLQIDKNLVESSTATPLYRLLESSVKEILEYYSDLGDVQTCVTISIVLGNRLDNIIDINTLEAWYLAYIDLLKQLKLFVNVAEVIKFSKMRLGYFSQIFTTVKPFCKCGKSLQGDNVVCQKCKIHTARCLICQLPVQGLFLACHKCGKGGHMDHMTAWFSKKQVCPNPACSIHVSKIQALHDS